jgi:hypothetical protein
VLKEKIEAEVAVRLAGQAAGPDAGALAAAGG